MGEALIGSKGGGRSVCFIDIPMSPTLFATSTSLVQDLDAPFRKQMFWETNISHPMLQQCRFFSGVLLLSSFEQPQKFEYLGNEQQKRIQIPQWHLGTQARAGQLKHQKEQARKGSLSR
jgi:hypothetical protein